MTLVITDGEFWGWRELNPHPIMFKVLFLLLFLCFVNFAALLRIFPSPFVFYLSDPAYVLSSRYSVSSNTNDYRE